MVIHVFSEPYLLLHCFMFARNRLGACTMEADNVDNRRFTMLRCSETCLVIDVGKFIKMQGPQQC